MSIFFADHEIGNQQDKIQPKAASLEIKDSDCSPSSKA